MHFLQKKTNYMSNELRILYLQCLCLLVYLYKDTKDAKICEVVINKLFQHLKNYLKIKARRS